MEKFRLIVNKDYKPPTFPYWFAGCLALAILFILTYLTSKG